MKDLNEQKNREEFFKLIAENPDLPIVPMVVSEVVADDSYARWRGSWGMVYIGEYFAGEEQFYFRDDDDPAEFRGALIDKYGYDEWLDMDDEQEARAYAELPWIKAIIVNIDLAG